MQSDKLKLINMYEPIVNLYTNGFILIKIKMLSLYKNFQATIW